VFKKLLMKYLLLQQKSALLRIKVKEMPVAPASTRNRLNAKGSNLHRSKAKMNPHSHYFPTIA
jgi:hypothetical protein